METRLAMLHEGSNIFCVSPELAHSDEIEAYFFPASKHSLILQVFSAPSWVFFKYVSKSNNLLPLCCSLPLAAFLLDGSPLSATLRQCAFLMCLLLQMGTVQRSSMKLW